MSRPTKITAICAISRHIACAVACVSIFATSARAADIHIGATRAQKTLSAGVASAQAGDHLILDPGVYLDDTATISKPLSIDGSGAILRVTHPLENHKGILIVDADLTVTNLTFDGAQVTDTDGKNGAGIRMQSGNLIVEGCTFLNNQDGILANPNAATSILIARSIFDRNGAGDGYTHAIYANAVGQLTVTDSVFSGTKVGHDIKSRALKTTVRNTVLDDGVTGTTSYAIDLPNGGIAVLDGLHITQGQNTSNTTMIAYGAEGSLHPTSSLSITNSTFINIAATATGVYNFTNISVNLNGNTFQNVSTPLRGNGKIADASAAVLHDAAVISSTQPDAQSYLRFYNAGPNAGTVDVTLHSGDSGEELVRWRSPNIPIGAAPQFAIADIEATAGPTLVRPSFYTATITPQINGSYQRVLYYPKAGALTNFSTCDSGQTANGQVLTNVHSSMLDKDFPSVVIVRNTGPSGAVATLSIFDASSGIRLGSFTSAAIAPEGQALLAVAAIEAGAKIPPGAVAHYNMKIENDFSGTLQHLLTNRQAAIVTDMTTACALIAQ